MILMAMDGRLPEELRDSPKEMIAFWIYKNGCERIKENGIKFKDLKLGKMTIDDFFMNPSYTIELHNTEKELWGE